MKLAILRHLLLFLPFVVRAQSRLSELDSLHRNIQLAKNDTIRMFAFADIGTYYDDVSIDSSIYYAEKAIALAKQMNLRLDEAMWYSNLIWPLCKMGNYPKALKSLNLALDLAGNPVNEKYVSKLSAGQTARSYRLHVLCWVHHAFAGLYGYTGNFEKGIVAADEARTIAENLKDSLLLSFIFNEKGNAYLKLNKPDSALFYNQLAVAYNEAVPYKKFQANNYIQVGETFLHLGDIVRAKENFEKAIRVSALYKNTVKNGEAHLQLAHLFQSQNKIDSSLDHSKQALSILKPAGKEKSTAIAYRMISDCYLKLGNPDSSFAYLRLATVLKDKLEKAEKEKIQEFQVTGFEETLRLEALEKEKIQTQNKIRTYSLLGGLAVLSMIGVFLYRNNRQKQKANQVLNSKNKELEIEAALERVRNQAMAMHKSDDLLNVSMVLYKELKMLGIDEIRNAMILIHDEKNDFFIDYDYSSIGSKITRIPTNGIPLIEKYIKDLKENEKSKVNFLELIVTGEELESWKNARKATGQLDDPRLDSIETLYYYHYSIGAGNVSISTFSSLSNKKLQVLERFRNVFQLPYQRYHDIEIAVAQSEQARVNLIQIQTEKKRAEDALAILKATQAQLIQSEKLASLGELTAGIAHEIQNPLNFVNNFSEINLELAAEINDAVEKGDLEEVKALTADIRTNQEKIREHGKRADAIVKGMLQHSQKGSGVKEPTNINALADEYLRLAYHGLKAKDRSFNATINTDFDQSIGNINIIPQDIGRVFLNLINNAFYAVNEKKKQIGDSYEPEVTVTTKRLTATENPSIRQSSNSLIVSVKDNGKGIPENISQKIFQPFFTTKPTGEGTGLGLSLSYDIIKAHGGEIKVESKEGEGTSFEIKLPY